jgi:hypothetical protein
MQDIIPKLKQFYKELFDKSFPEKLEGLDIIKTLEYATKKYNIKFIIYHHDDNERYNLSNNFSGFHPNWPVVAKNPSKNISNNLF